MSAIWLRSCIDAWDRRASSFIIFAALGVPLALVESLPYMMVGMFSPREKHGQLLGKLNVWIGKTMGTEVQATPTLRII